MTASAQRRAVVYKTMGRALARYRWLAATVWLRGEARQTAALAKAHARTAREMAAAIAEVGGLYIKVGQLVSVVGAWLPSPFRDELASLQDQVPGRPLHEIKARVEAELAAPLADRFASFADVPLAAASIGQVHRATLHDGTEVVVKVQYPGLEQTVADDLVTLAWVFDTLTKHYPYAGFREMFAEISALVMQELDFAAEAANVGAFERAFAGRRDIAVPQVIASHSTSRVLTMTYQAGSPLSEGDPDGLGGEMLARQLMGLYCEQVFAHGLYHADPHPGNLRVRRGADEVAPQLVMLDFGAVARVAPQTRQGILRLLHGVLTHDTAQVVASLRALGFVAKRSGDDDAMDDAFHRIVSRLHQHFAAQVELNPATVQQLVQDPARLFARVGQGPMLGLAWREVAAVFHVPGEFIALQRTMLLLFGVCRGLAPSLDPMTLVAPHVQRYMTANAGEWTASLGEITKDYVVGMLAMPGQLKALAEQMQQLKEAQRAALVATTRAHRLLRRALIGACLLAVAAAVALYVAWPG
ncbi:MAG: AarF/ABC1/UbiB kinase family protein [Myxococcales bacterium]|nr:AarF/ABC1/UbiB kinase family protein [Myxococcales bacterium]